MPRTIEKTSTAILTYLMQQEGKPKTAQEIATGISVHATTVRRALGGRRVIPGVLPYIERRKGITRHADQWYYDSNVATEQAIAYRNNDSNNDSNTEENTTVILPNNSLTTNILDMANLHSVARDSIAESLKTPGLSYDALRTRLANALAALDSSDINEQSKLVYLYAITGSIFQLTLDLSNSD